MKIWKLCFLIWLIFGIPNFKSTSRKQSAFDRRIRSHKLFFIVKTLNILNVLWTYGDCRCNQWIPLFFQQGHQDTPPLLHWHGTYFVLRKLTPLFLSNMIEVCFEFESICTKLLPEVVQQWREKNHFLHFQSGADMKENYTILYNVYIILYVMHTSFEQPYCFLYIYSITMKTLVLISCIFNQMLTRRKIKPPTPYITEVVV